MHTPGVIVHGLALPRGCLQETITPGEEGVTLARREKVFCTAAPIFGSTSGSSPRVARALPKALGDPLTPGPFNGASFP